MGCSSSKLDDEEAVQLCKDRKNFIKKAVEQRTKFASGHKAYLQSLKRVSAALKDYIEGDEPREFSLNSFTTPTLPTAKKTAPRFITISPNSFTVDQPKVNYLKSGGNPSVFVEERPPESPETARVESYNNNNYNYNYNYNDSPVYQYANDNFFGMQNRPNLPPPSPQRSSSNWDFFWNPFSSLDYYGYPARNSSNNHQSMFDDDINGLQQVREEEGIPELEEETEHEFEPEIVHNHNHNVNHNPNHRMNMRSNDHKDEVTIEDIDDEDEFETDSGEEETESEHEPESSSHFDPRKSQNLEVLKAENSGKMANNGTSDLGMNKEKCKTEGTPGFTVYVNRRPTSMSEVIKDLEAQFTIITDSAKELSVMLEANRAQYSSTSHELTG